MEHLTCQIKTNRRSKNYGGPELDSLNKEGVNMIYDQTYPGPDFNECPEQAIVIHRLHVCVQNAGVFWCSGVSQEMKIKDVHEMYSWI